MKSFIFTLVLVFSLTSCNKSSNAIVSSKNSVKIVSSTSFSNTTTDDYQISDAIIIDDSLEITVRVGGGCGQLNFSLIANENVIETMPEQQMIKLILDDKDSCKALLEEKHSFDISELKIGFHGTVILHLEGFDGGLEYKY
jgi:hypothetical protein